METLMIILSGILVTVGTYLILSKKILRIIIGSSVLSHAVHLFLMTMGKLKTGTVPIVGEGVESYTDGLPQALILTAIVIGFGVNAFLLVLTYRMYEETSIDEIDRIRGIW